MASTKGQGTGSNPKSKANLRPCKTKEEARRRGALGGKASAKARAERKALREIAETCLYDTLINESGKVALKRKGIVIDDKQSLQAIYGMMYGLIAEGMKGNANSAKLVLDAAGLLPKEDESEKDDDSTGVVIIAPVLETADE